MMGHNSRYLNLKVQILEVAGNSFSLALIKEHFSAVINSKRSLSRVKSLACILGLLEERDLINSKNINCLEQLGELLNNSRIKELVHNFKKLYLDDSEELCSCGILANSQSDSIPISQLQIIETNNQVNPNTELSKAAQNIAQRIGSGWPYLARALNMKECQLERFRAQYPKNYQQQAQAALDFWLTWDNVSLECLDRALNSRHCEHMGIGTYLRQPIM